MERIISLKVKNLALIEELNVDFCDKLNIFTGETGAGKSIIIDAIFMLLGTKIDKTIIKEGCEFSRVEGVFEINNKDNELNDILQGLGILDEAYISLARTYYKNGKSEYRINGEICTQNLFKIIYMCSK